MDFIRREETNVLVDERKVLDQIAEVIQQASFTDPGMLSREELADLVTDLAAEAERLSAIAGRFLAVGEASACSYTKGESTMIGLVNAKGHLSRARACSLRRAGNAHHRFPNFHQALLEGSITLAHVIPRHREGQTMIANGQLLCRVHHRWKHRLDPDPGPSTELTRLFVNSPVLVQRE